MPRRRWLQFSLRSFFVLLTVGCLWLGWKVERTSERTRQQREAVKAIEALTGRVQYDWQPKMVEVTLTAKGLEGVKGWQIGRASCRERV